MQRQWQTDESTISTFSTEDGSVKGYMLEPAGPSTTKSGLDRRIPAGEYDVVPHSSADYPNAYRLHNSQVPDNRGILIHSGNSPGQTKGCLMPGSTRGTNWVGNSGPTKRTLYNYIFRYQNYGGTKLIIYDPIVP